MSPKRTYQLGENGKPVGLPFHVPYTFSDFSENEEEYVDYLNNLYDQYEEVAKTLRPSEPHPLTFSDDEAYQRKKEAWREDNNEERMARAMSKALFARDQAIRPPHYLSREEKILRDGNEADKSEFRARMDQLKVVNQLFERSAEERGYGNTKKAQELWDMAMTQKRGLQECEKNYEYSFVAEGLKKDLDFGKATAEEMMKWTPEKVKENIPLVESILQGWRDLSDEECSYILDTGSPYKADKEATFKVVRLEHPGVRSKDLGALSNEKTAQGLLDHAYRVGYAVKEYEPPEAEEGPVEEGQGQWEDSLKPVV